MQEQSKRTTRCRTASMGVPQKLTTQCTAKAAHDAHSSWCYNAETNLVEACNPEVCTTEEEEQHQPEEPGTKLAVAVYGGAQQRGQGFAEQNTLCANHAAEQGVADGQSLHPAMGHASQALAPADENQAVPDSNDR